jgi:hypothetical protein
MSLYQRAIMRARTLRAQLAANPSDVGELSRLLAECDALATEIRCLVSHHESHAESGLVTVKSDNKSDGL